MRRFVYGLITAISACLCLLLSAMWVRSRTTDDWMSHAFLVGERPYYIEVWSRQSQIGLKWTHFPRSDFTEPPATTKYLDESERAPTTEIALNVGFERLAAPLFVTRFHLRPSAYGSFFGFTHMRNGDGTYVDDFFAIPYAFPVSLFAIVPLWRLAKFVRSGRYPPGCCRSCGYDLRASPERCPECGRTIKHVRAA